jgi:hypothetical protein
MSLKGPTVVDVVVTRDPAKMLPGVDNRLQDQEGGPGRRLRERPLVGRHFSVANASSRRTQRYVSIEFAGDFDADC